MKVLLVCTQMFGYLLDPRGEERNLDLGRACVVVRGSVLSNDFRLSFLGQGHTCLAKASVSKSRRRLPLYAKSQVQRTLRTTATGSGAWVGLYLRSTIRALRP